MIQITLTPKQEAMAARVVAFIRSRMDPVSAADWNPTPEEFVQERVTAALKDLKAEFEAIRRDDIKARFDAADPATQQTVLDALSVA